MKPNFTVFQSNQIKYMHAAKNLIELNFELILNKIIILLIQPGYNTGMLYVLPLRYISAVHLVNAIYAQPLRTVML